MTTIDAVLRHALEVSGRDLILTLDPALQGLPDTAHGGSVLAVFDALSSVTAPREVSGLYRRRVPLALPLTLLRARENSADTFVLSEAGGSVLVEGRVAPQATDAVTAAPSRPGGDGVAPLRPVLSGSNRRDVTALVSSEVAGVVPAEPPRPRPADDDDAARGAYPLPVSRACFACGTENAVGLRARLAFDADTVRGTWQPRAPFRRDDGSLAPAALTTLLDEAAFWLGALATGESGMTTELRVALHAARTDPGGLLGRYHDRGNHHQPAEQGKKGNYFHNQFLPESARQGKPTVTFFCRCSRGPWMLDVEC